MALFSLWLFLGGLALDNKLLETDVQLIVRIDHLLACYASLTFERSYNGRRLCICLESYFKTESNHKILRGLLINYR